MAFLENSGHAFADIQSYSSTYQNHKLLMPACSKMAMLLSLFRYGNTRYHKPTSLANFKY